MAGIGSDFGRELGEAFSAFGKIIKAHYGLAGKYTQPLQKTEKTTELSEVSSPGAIAAQVILFPVPVLSWVTSLTIAPLIGNSITSIGRTVKGVSQFAWTGKRNLDAKPDERNPVRKIYGAPGNLIGLGISLVPATFGVIRQIGDTSKRTFVSFTNLLVHSDDRLKWEGFEENDERHWFAKYGLGGVGILVGGALGLLSISYRLVKESFITGYRTSAFLLNFIKPEYDRSQSEDKRNVGQKYILGFPGLVIGAALGSALSLIVNSMITAQRIAISMLRLVMPDDSAAKLKTPSLIEDERHWLLKGIVGAPGLFFGVVAGAVLSSAYLLLRVIGNSFISAGHMIKFMTSSAWHLSFQTDALPDIKDKALYGYGFPGLIIGTLIGAAMSVFTLSLHFLRANFEVLINFLQKIAAWALPRRDNETFLEFLNRHDPVFPWHRRHFLGVIGAPLGAVLGAAGFLLIGGFRVLGNSLQSAAKMVAFFVKSARTGSWEMDQLPERNRAEFGLGFPGVLIGSTLGLVIGGIVWVARHTLPAVSGFLKYNAQLLANVAATIWNVVLSNGKQVKVPFAWKPRLAIGFFGGAIGAVIGVAGAAVIALFRTLKNSLIMTVHMTGLITASAWDNRKNGDWPKRKVKNLVFGAPGLVIGTILGGAIAAVIYTARWLRLNLVAFGFGFVGFVKYFAGAASSSIGEQSLEIFDPGLWNRVRGNLSMPLSLVLGIPGWLLGFTAGVVIGIPVGFFIGTVKTLWQLTGAISRHARHPLVRYTNEQTQDGTLAQRIAVSVKSVFGIPAIIPGLILGCIGFATIAVARFMDHTALTAKSTLISLLKLVLPAHLTENWRVKDLRSDKRHGVAKFIVGSPGFLIGALIAVLPIAAIWGARVVAHTALTARSVFASIVKPFLHTEDQEKFKVTDLQTDTRSERLKYGLGILGFVFGGFAGAVTLPFIAAGRIASNSAKSLKSAFWTVLNPLIRFHKMKHDPLFNPNSLPANLFAEERPAALKYILGAPGILIGFIAGAVAGAGLVLLGMAKESVKSWAALTGSFVNLYIGRQRFNGLAGDARKHAAKGFGWLGYVVGAITAVILLPVLLVRLAPLALLHLLAAVLSPLVALKVASDNRHRFTFDNTTAEHSDSTQRFKNLYSALDGHGMFRVDRKIAELGDGKQTFFASLRKAFLFNKKSVTEKILNEIYEHCKSKGYLADSQALQNFLNTTEFDDLVARVTAVYKPNAYETKDESKAKVTLTEDLAKSIKNYLLKAADSEQMPEDIYSKDRGEIGISNTFFGKKAKAEDALLDVLDREESDSEVVMDF